MNLKGKIAVLTGGKRVGVAVTKTLAAQGVNFVLSYQNSKSIAEKTVLELRKIGVRAFAVKADVSREKDVKKLFRFALKKFGRVDFLIHMASTFTETPWKMLNEKIWDKEMANNLKSAFLCAKNAGDIMLKQMSEGKIILMGDARADRPYAGRLPYLAAKAGVHALVKILAVELAPKITVNGIAPGMALPSGQTKKHLRKIQNRTLLKRLGSPSDIAETVLFILEKGDYITGEILRVDAGVRLE